MSDELMIQSTVTGLCPSWPQVCVACARPACALWPLLLGGFRALYGPPVRHSRSLVTGRHCSGLAMPTALSSSQEVTLVHAQEEGGQTLKDLVHAGIRGQRVRFLPIVGDDAALVGVPLGQTLLRNFFCVSRVVHEAPGHLGREGRREHVHVVERTVHGVDAPPGDRGEGLSVVQLENHHVAHDHSPVPEAFCLSARAREALEQPAVASAILTCQPFDNEATDELVGNRRVHVAIYLGHLGDIWIVNHGRLEQIVRGYEDDVELCREPFRLLARASARGTKDGGRRGRARGAAGRRRAE
mmetsp:Transcript_11138/g.32973  ORF Transcript_11138/g.32973 Transcript_11138/m.32973 type:complete len:299 (-) Transcript_11138:692-1588(-)